MSYLLRRVDPKRRDDLVRKISLALQKAESEISGNARKADIAERLKLKLQHASGMDGVADEALEFEVRYDAMFSDEVTPSF